MSDYGGQYGEGERFTATYQGLGAFGSGDEPPGGGRNRRAIVVSVIVAVLLLAGAGATIYFLSRPDDGPEPVTKPTETIGQTTTGTTTTSQQPTTTAPTTTAPTTTAASGDHVIDATIAGWQGVLSAQDKAAYDVPPGWRIEDPGFVSGFEGNSQRVHGVSTYKPEACPDVDGSIRGRAGFGAPEKDDPASAARAAATRWAEAAAGVERGSDKVTVGSPKSVQIDGGKLTAKVVTASAKGPKGSCSAPKVQATAAAFESDGQTVLFVLYVDKGVDDELDDGIANTIISSLRPQDAKP